MSAEFDAYEAWLGIPKEHQPPDHYQLLGLRPFEQDTNAITRSADERLNQVRSFKTGPNATIAQAIESEIVAARALLLDPAKKKAYDTYMSQLLTLELPPPAAQPIPTAKRAPAHPTATPAVAPQVFAIPSRSLNRRKKSNFATVAFGLLLLSALAAGGFWAAKKDMISLVLPGSGNRESPKPSIDSSGTSGATAPQIVDSSDNSVSPASSPGLLAESDRAENDKFGKAANGTAPDASMKFADDPEPAVMSSDPKDPATDLIGVEQPYVPARSAAKFADVFDDDQAADPSSSEKKLPIPSEEDRKAAQQRIDADIGAEISAAKTPEAKLAVASKIFQRAAQTPAESAERYVLFESALKLAVAIGEWRGIQESINGLAKSYDVPHLEMKADSLSKATDIKDVLLANDAVRMVNDLIDQAVKADRYDLADRFTAIGARVRRNAVHGYYLRDLTERMNRLKELKTAFEPVAAAQKILESDPNDPEANLTVGRYLTIFKNQWRAGVPYLAKGSNPELRAIAEQELVKDSDSARQVQVAEAWVALADKTSDPSLKQAYRKRAGSWYKLALGKLNGSAAENIAEAIANLDAHGLKAVYYEGNNFEKEVLKKTDANIDFDWNMPPISSPAKGQYSVRWSGFIAAPSPGNYRLIIDHDDGMRVAIDGKAAIDGWKSPGKQEIILTFKRAPRAIRIDYSNRTGSGKCRLRWAQENGFAAESVPSDALFPDRPSAQQALAHR